METVVVVAFIVIIALIGLLSFIGGICCILVPIFHDKSAPAPRPFCENCGRGEKLYNGKCSYCYQETEREWVKCGVCFEIKPANEVPFRICWTCRKKVGHRVKIAIPPEK